MSDVEKAGPGSLRQKGCAGVDAVVSGSLTTANYGIET